MVSLDLCIVSARRPELLAVTLDSFSQRVFSRLVPERVFVNLDPIFGSEEDHAAVLSIVRKRFPEATIFEPETPGFGAAVKRLWLATKADYVFHLEDDWVALRTLDDEIFLPFNDARVQQTSFHTADQNWDIKQRGHIHHRRIYFKPFGIKLPLYRTLPKFTTSPSILRGDFARSAAALMIPEHDPEKQFYSSVNMDLERMAHPFRNYIFSPEGIPVIKDIGREWREAQGIRKVVTNGTSVWSSEGNGPSAGNNA
ncbi:glycosyltransferase family 2 protein [Pleomorphomonas oryzae]|uniref:glycosyltransferase family 2 protein n=1 Tax=Pleomorphomonas oryzae TaxID=261934 RepID=UPI001FE1175C|nr:hypothetical protein [Pleomorphomonas oryzae]